MPENESTDAVIVVAGDADAPGVARNARLGFRLFVVYFALYAGFMALAAFAPRRMGTLVVGGVNLAIVYGFGLIVLALALALVYMVLAGPRRTDLPTPAAAEAGQ